MLNLDEGRKAVLLARKTIDYYIKKNTVEVSDYDDLFLEKQGTFVTLHTYPDHDLRGCIGIPLPVMLLKDAIVEAAKSSTRDPRFSPLRDDELEKIIIEVTILTKPKIISVSNPKDYLLNVKIGRDGLIVEKGYYKGLLLPQVPVEQGWDVEEFLSHTCMKAGLLPDAWYDENIKILKFSGQIFTELKPYGKIVEKHIDGSNN